MGSLASLLKLLPRWVNPFYLLALLLPLIFMLAIPSLRLPLRKCALGGRIFDDPLPILFTSSNSRSNYQNYMEELPDSLDAKIWALSGIQFNVDIPGLNGVGTNGISPQMKEFDQLARAHPKDPFYLVAALTFLPADGRIAGPWENEWDASIITRNFPSAATPLVTPIPVPPAPQNLGRAVAPKHPPSPRAFDEPPPAPVPTPTPANYSGPLSPESVSLPTDRAKPMTPAALALGLDLVRRGRNLEPGNAYFDWKAATLLFAAHRDDEAIGALLVANRKTDTRLHAQELAGAGIRSFDSIEPLLAEEKWVMVGLANSTLSPSDHHLISLLLWKAMEKEDAGNEAAAFQIDAALAQSQWLRFQHATSDSERYLAIHDLERIWTAPALMRSARAMRARPRFRWSARDILPDAAQFSRYARSKGRNDLASQTSRWANSLVAWAQRPEPSSSVYFSDDRDSAMKIELWWWGSVLALWQITWTLGLLFLFAVPGLWRTPQPAEADRVSERATFSPLGLGFALFAVLTAISMKIIIHSWVNGDSMDPLVPLGWLAVLSPSLAVLIWSMLTTTWKVQRIKLPKIPRRRISHEEARAMPPQERVRIRFWRIINFLWFRALPVVMLFYFQFCLLIWLGVKVPPGTPWRDWGSVLLDPDGMRTGLLVSSALYILGAPVRWHSAMAAEHRPTVYAGFYAVRRALTWSIPLSLWLLLATLVMGNIPRQKLEGQIEAAMAKAG